jgi:hypothetical protein
MANVPTESKLALACVVRRTIACSMPAMTFDSVSSSGVVLIAGPLSTRH